MMEKKVDLPMSIPEFYKGKSIFLTGFTGVIGKILVEKLLYSCPELDTIYVLIRPKKGLTPQQRVEQVLTSMAFTRLREKHPGILESKVVGVAGDMIEERLGLSQEDEQLLRREVSIILHGAASVRFDDPLDFAVQINTLGAKRMVDLALTMPRLISFAYISTAYTNCDHLHIKEEVYPPKADWRKTVEITKIIDRASLETLKAKYIDKMPNTYTFSKSLAEQVINDYRDQLPVVIVRPSIVTNSSKEPLVGWVDNKYGVIGITLGIFLGLIKCTSLNPNLKLNNIPSDIVVKAVIIAAMQTALTQCSGSGEDSTIVYNVCTPESHVHSVEYGYDTLYTDKEIIADLKNDGIFYEPFVPCYSNLSYRINVLFRHVISSCIVDLLLILSRRQPMLVKIRRKLFCLNQDMYHFSFNSFTFESSKFDNLVNHKTPEEREEFGWDSDMYDDYHNNIVKFKSLKLTILKPVYDDVKTVSRALRMMFIVDKFAVYLTYSTIGFFIYYFNIPTLLLSTAVRLVTLP